MKEMKKMVESLAADVLKVQFELEDHFEFDGLAAALKDYRKRLKAILQYEPVITEEDTERRGQLKCLAYGYQMESQKALDRLATVTAKSNVFDVIDVLRFVYGRLVYCADENE